MTTKIADSNESIKGTLFIHKKLKKIIGNFGIFFVLILLLIIGSFATPSFLTMTNIMNVFRQNSFIILMSCGITMLIISGQTDLSAGAVCAFGGCVGIDIYIKTGSFILAFLSAILVGVVCGAINGIIATKFNVPSFIATLAMQIAARGAVLLYTGGQNIYNIGDIGQFGKGATPIYFAGVVCFLTWFVLSKTRYGRYLYAVGGNAEVALASGVKAEMIRIDAYIVCSAISAFTGVLLMGRLNSASPIAANGYEFEAIIGAIIGGTSFHGGIGNIGGSIVGCLIVGFINNILNLLGIQSYIHQVIKGFIIAFAVTYDINMRNRKSN